MNERVNMVGEGFKMMGKLRCGLRGGKGGRTEAEKVT